MPNRAEADHLSSQPSKSDSMVKIDFSVLENLMKGQKGEQEKTILQNILATEKERIATQKKLVSDDFDPMQIGWKLQEIAHKEKKSRGELLMLAQKMVQEEFGLDEKTLPKISFKFGPKDLSLQSQIDASEFTNTHRESEELASHEKAHLNEEQQVRHIQNMLITGSGQRAFDLLDKYKEELDAVDPTLHQNYYDMVITQMDFLHNDNPNTMGPRNNAGLTKLTSGGKDGKVRIHVEADIFPVLTHEIMKGVTEYLSMARYSSMSQEMKESILSVDSYQDEHRQMLIGGQLRRQLYFCIQEAVQQVADKEGLIEGKPPKQYFAPIYQRINQLPAQEYLHFIQTLTDGSDGSKAIATIKKVIGTIHQDHEAYQAQLQATKQKIYTQDDIEKSLQAKRSPECQVFLAQYQHQLTEKLKDFYPKTLAPRAVERSIITKIEKYFANGVVEAGMEEIPDEQETGENIQQEQRRNIAKLQGQELYDHVIEVVTELQKELLRVSALKELYHEKRTRLKGQGGKGKAQIVYTTKDIEEREEKLSKDPAYTEQVSIRIQEYSILKLFQDHKMHTGLINELYAKLLSLDDLKPELLHDFGDYQLYNLRTADQLVDEGLKKNLRHCVSGQASNIANGSVVIWSVRSNKHKNPLNRQTNTFYTIGYNPSSQTIIQWKGYKNYQIRTHDKNKDEMLEILARLCKNYKIKSVNDWGSVIKDFEILWDDMSITTSDSDHEIIKQLLAGKHALLNRPHILSLPYDMPAEDMKKICKMPGYTFNLTFLSQPLKNQLEYVAGSFVDTNTSILYPNLKKVDGWIDIKEAESHATSFPKLQSLAGCMYNTFKTTYLHEGKQEQLPDAPSRIDSQQKAQHEKRESDKELYNSCDMLRVKGFVKYEQDTHGDRCTTFPTLGLSVRHEYLRGGKMKQGDYDGKNDYKVYNDSYLFSDNVLKGNRNCIYKNTIDKQKQTWKDAMDVDCYGKGYTWQTKAQLDTILSALAGQLGIGYNPNTTDEQEVVKAYMYLRGSLGWEWMNTEYETGREGDKYGQYENNSFDSRWVLLCNSGLQRVSWPDYGTGHCSIPLIKSLG